MRLLLLHERKSKHDKHFFDYKSIAKEKWHELLGQAKEEYGIAFDTENDDAVNQRTISLAKQKDALSKPRFKCELRLACGDWQVPVAYFRVQLVDGWAKGLSHYSNPFFCFIPDGADGNTLDQVKSGWTARDNQGTNEQSKPDERKCWAALNRHLEEITKGWKDEQR